MAHISALENTHVVILGRIASAVGQSTVCTITVLSCHANNVNQDLWEILDGVGTLIKLIYHTVNKDEYKKSDILPERLCQRYRLS